MESGGAGLSAQERSGETGHCGAVAAGNDAVDQKHCRARATGHFQERQLEPSFLDESAPASARHCRPGGAGETKSQNEAKGSGAQLAENRTKTEIHHGKNMKTITTSAMASQPATRRSDKSERYYGLTTLCDHFTDVSSHFI